MDSKSCQDAITIAITHDRIGIEMFRKTIEDVDVGAHAWFEGVTRRMTGEQETMSLSYDGFAPMALREMRRIGESVVAEFGLTKLVVVHRLGAVPIGEASLIVGCSSPHRAAVFPALAKVVDRLKTDVPIWKKEHFADGSTQWVHPT